MKCELCGKKSKDLYADCVFNEMLCEDCACKYDHHNKENVIKLHDKVFMKNILSNFITQ